MSVLARRALRCPSTSARRAIVPPALREADGTQHADVQAFEHTPQVAQLLWPRLLGAGQDRRIGAARHDPGLRGIEQPRRVDHHVAIVGVAQGGEQRVDRVRSREPDAVPRGAAAGKDP
jgi:hypothetical protein